MVLATRLMLRLVGFFQELGTGRHYEDSLLDVTADHAEEDEAKLVQYLRDGHILLDVPETSRDVISRDRSVVGAPSLVTDGNWLWRLDLQYYLARYHLRLPRDFREHVRGLDYRMPVLTEQELERAGIEALHYF